ncbi:LysE family translocator [Psychrosphaera ytuae]|uniref:LysE family translocator n=1 Tax=Psychrosphaera ytuae TaxID=2820710 RepID=A0A975DBF5_9GAMM|nr:LysE family translocator [Psychrosphaera ytuae]QTH63221.1 LysE family translocator [Psychrosphaera ytuae]
MTFEMITALMVFALVSSITPGPNNLMLMSSGATFGIKRTLPHLMGVALGFSFMLLMVGVGVVQLFNMWPSSYLILKVFSVIYLLYLAYKIANSSKASEHDASGTPMTFMQAVLFQWVNPKAWTMALTAVSVYAPDKAILTIVYVSFIFFLMNLPSVSLWAMMGHKLRRLLEEPKTLLLFNRIMALLLVISLIPVLIPV